MAGDEVVGVFALHAETIDRATLVVIHKHEVLVVEIRGIVVVSVDCGSSSSGGALMKCVCVCVVINSFGEELLGEISSKIAKRKFQ